MMELRTYLRIISLGLFFAIAVTAYAVEFPQPSGFVNDFSGVLSVEEKTSLETLVRSFERKTSNEIVIAVIQSLEGLDRFTYSQELFNQWKPGKQNKNNGILFLISIGDREAFINVGRGLEGALPDSLTGTILRQEVFPEFKAGNYGRGIERGIIAIMQATKGEYEGSGQQGTSDRGEARLEQFFGWFLWFGIILLSWLASFLGRTKSWWLGGVIGAVAGVVLGFIFWTGIVIVISAFVFCGFGSLFDYVVSKNYAYRKSHGKPTDFWHSGGGFWFGGGRSGFGGGGFGGFGGGMSGGGGAGGRW